jgi:hypothetical protein
MMCEENYIKKKEACFPGFKRGKKKQFCVLQGD